ncbi:MAG: cytidine deaminase [Draconibacterium sp.]|nr:cytidine deaminase [Draconibacterium sp.]
MNKTKNMYKRELKIFVLEFDSISEMSETDRELILSAREAAENAYAPYSKFQVGAALILENGELVKGNNQENADFTDGLCAERVALFYANANYPKSKVLSMAVSAKNANGLLQEPAQPCGSCRQVLVETEVRFNNPIRLILDGAKKIMVVESAESLLPFAFKPDALG